MLHAARAASREQIAAVWDEEVVRHSEAAMASLAWRLSEQVLERRAGRWCCALARAAPGSAFVFRNAA
jgi:hypothetical protein